MVSGRHRASAWLVLAVTACGGGPEPSEPEEEPPMTQLTFESLFAGIDRHPRSAPRERGAALQRELLASPADVMCLQGVWDAEARRALTDGLRPVFPHVLDLTTGQGAAIDPIPGHESFVPAEGPACGPLLVPPLDDLLHCLWLTCGEDDLDGERTIYVEDCLYSFDCRPALDAIDAADPEQRCGACARAHLRAGTSFEGVRLGCIEGDTLPYDGDAGLALLSRLPFESVDARILPGSSARRMVITARLARDGGPIDVYCATLGPTGETGLLADPHLTDPFLADPYPGPLGEGATGWQAENALQIEGLLAFIQARSGTTPAVVLGNLGVSSASTDGTGTALESMGATGAARLEAALVMAADPSAAPACTSCPGNPLVGLIPPTWPNRIFLHGLEAGAVVSTSRTYLGRVVEVEAGFYGTPQVRYLP
jgi:hypothetical protein